MDRLNRKQRSKNMAAVRSKGNKTTELQFAKFLRTNKIFGWRRHPKNIKGTPDFVFPLRKVIVFIDGCFWHGCSKHYKVPTTNLDFWKTKINKNISRDRIVNRELSSMGWKVVRFWEHEFKKNPNNILRKISKNLEK